MSIKNVETPAVAIPVAAIKQPVITANPPLVVHSTKGVYLTAIIYKPHE